MKIALGQVNPIVGDFDRNVEKILEFTERAKKEGARLVVFPELAMCGYPPMDLLLKDSFIQKNLDGLHHIKNHVSGIDVLVGFVDINPGSGRPLFNALAYLSEGAIKAVQYKTLLPTYDVFDEDRYFEPAHGYVVQELDDWKFGLSICEDIWNYKQLYPKPRYQVDPIEKIVEHKPDILINVSASPFSVGKEHIRHELVRNQALRHRIPVVYVNQVGGNDELVFDGRSLVVDANGALVARASAFEEDLLIVDIGKSTDSDRPWGSIKESPEDRIANTYRALTLGTRDYMAKCGFKKAVIGLSGGIDSAVVAVIAAKAVGSQNVIGVAMPSPFSSEHSLADAQQLANNLSIEFKTVPIESAMNAFDDMLKAQFEGTHRDVTEENIQARIRGATLMALSNKFGYLVLTTGNKSELAVGYCTLYGDMCGGLAVISDLPKTMVYDLARYMNESEGRELVPENTIVKAPSAELAPGQFDQDSLPPYVVLDGILYAYIEQRRSPDEIVRLGYDPKVVKDVITRIDRNEYKRAQAAPGLKISARAFGMGWRMPIAHKFREKFPAAVIDPSKMLC